MPSFIDVRERFSYIIHCRGNHTLLSGPREFLPLTPDTLFSIRAKKERGEPLTREEWQIFAHFIQIGSEFVRWSSIPQLQLLRAFRAAFEIRDHHKSRGTSLPY